jgi:hypothetical protein
MSDEGGPFPDKAFLVPTAWAVECPCCGAHVDVEETEQDDAGVYQGAREWCVAICEPCNVAIEVQGVRIVEVPGPPFYVRRG